MTRITLLAIAVFILTTISCKKSDVTPDENNDYTGEFNPGLLWKTGLAPQPSIPIPAGSRAWYVDADAPDGGNGSEASPFNSFEVVIGGYVNENYEAGLLIGGDHLYLTGEFLSGNNVNKRIEIARPVQGGTAKNPTLITAWPGKTRPIFNGEDLREYGILIRNSSGFRIESIEVKNSRYNGIRLMDPTENCFVEVLNCEVYHTSDAGDSGVNGGIALGTISGCDYTVRNNLIYSNHQSPGAFGGVIILSEGSVAGGAIAKIFDNIIYDETQAIAHKHCGGVIIHAHHNLIHSSFQAMYIRAFRNNQIYNNIILNCGTAFVDSRENMQNSQFSTIKNNTIVNSGMALEFMHVRSTLPPGMDYDDNYNFSNNIFYQENQSVVLGLALNTNEDFDIANWVSEKNIYLHADTDMFLLNQGVGFNFNNALIYLSDKTSITDDPEFLDIANNDFRLSENSPARGFAVNGEDVGALPYGSTYILDINRYTVQ